MHVQKVARYLGSLVYAVAQLVEALRYKSEFFIDIILSEQTHLLVWRHNKSCVYKIYMRRCGSSVFWDPIVGRPVHRTATYRCDDTRGCIIQF